nr:742_t:CDS:2 [Entrophospora candida]
MNNVNKGSISISIPTFLRLRLFCSPYSVLSWTTPKEHLNAQCSHQNFSEIKEN